MAIVRESWLYKNDNRRYPFVDTAELPAGFPDSAVVDIHIALPGTLKNERLYFTRLALNNNLVSLEIAGVISGPLFTLTATAPLGFRNYMLAKVDSQFTGHGYICFGSAAQSETQYALDRDMTVEQTEILPSLITRVPGLPFAYVGSGNTKLRGDIPIKGENGVIVREDIVAVPHGEGTAPRRCITISLEEDLETMEKPLRECQIPLESGFVPEQEDQPLLSLNGVLPTEAGVIIIELYSQEFDYEDGYGHTFIAPLVELDPHNDEVLRFKSNADVTDLCGSTKNRNISYNEPGCTPTVVERDLEERVYLGAVFIHRQYLVIYWSYGGSGGVRAYSDDDVGDISVTGCNEIGRYTDQGVSQDYGFDVTGRCEPIDSGRYMTVAKTVVTLDKVFRDKDCLVIANIGGNIVEEFEIDDPIHPYYLAKNSPFSVSTVNIRDPFLFDGSYMTAADQEAIEQEIADYIAGNDPWEVPE